MIQPTKKRAVSIWIQDGSQLQLIAEVPQELSASIIMQLRTAGVSRPTKNARPVEVVAVDPVKVAAWPQIDVQALRPGVVFTSAMAASIHLGFDSNQVSACLTGAIRLARRKSNGQGAPNPPAVVRGVTFRYLEPAGSADTIPATPVQEHESEDQFQDIPG